MSNGLSQNTMDEKAVRDESPSRQFNWPIFAGIVLITIIAILAVIGPNIAPKDPSEEMNITQITFFY